MPRTPRYREIETYLRTLVADSREGDLLPTVAELCERFGVSGVQTVRNAYEPLVEEGLVTVQMRPRRRWKVARVAPAADAGTGADIRAALAELERDAREHLGRIVALRESLAA